MELFEYTNQWLSKANSEYDLIKVEGILNFRFQILHANVELDGFCMKTRRKE
jgi:hypothetical protein